MSGEIGRTDRTGRVESNREDRRSDRRPSLAVVLALVTCHAARDVDTDLPLLRRELPEAEVVVWDDRDVDWSRFEVVVLRSPWDYHRRREEFIRWAAGVTELAALWNPLGLVEWNTDKRYLSELERHGIPTVPTTFVRDRGDIDRLASRGGFDGDVVVKPTVGASASWVLVARADPGAAVRHARTLVVAGLTPMVQPYLSGVEIGGETGLVYLAGEFSHSLRRRVILPPDGVGGDVLGDERSEARAATTAERSVGDAVMGYLPATAYARIDLLATPEGPVVLEVEVTEPSLFLHLDPNAPARAAAAFRSL